MSDPRSPAQILLVDDDPDDVAVALRAVRLSKDLDVRLAIARDGHEALEVLGVEANGGDTTPISPCVVFLDLEMPRVDGREVLRRLRANPRTKELPVVIISWSAQQKDIDGCYSLGANSFLVKRFTQPNPGAYFTDAVRYWVSLNQPPCVSTAAMALQ